MKKVPVYDADALVEEYGSPLFVASAEAITANLEALRREFSSRYPRLAVSYSYKVGSIPGILEVVHRDGTWAEVASGFEYELARRLGVPGTSIVFNGPYKTREELERALDEGALVNVDNRDELETLKHIAAARGGGIAAGIRVSTDVGINQLPDRFGFNFESGEAEKAALECAAAGIRVAGLHIHLTSYIIRPGGEEGSPARDIELIWPKNPDAYRRAAENLARLAKDLESRHGIKIEYIDMGGGFPSVGALGPYVDAVTAPLLAGFEDSEPPLLILEPGRAVVGDAVDLIATVVSSKDLSGGGRAVVIDAGVNLLPTSFWRHQTVELPGNPEGEPKETIVYGPLCLQTDIVTRAALPPLAPGDRIVIRNVGAYNIPQSGTFIFPRPPIILLDNGAARVVRERETVESAFFK
ncbi:MAG TPA: alanine racemase [Thermodesulfobacteriota bacterium]|nr:alanine racemase [Thermodesulfobacteriota bacterium]